MIIITSVKQQSRTSQPKVFVFVFLIPLLTSMKELVKQNSIVSFHRSLIHFTHSLFPLLSRSFMNLPNLLAHPPTFIHSFFSPTHAPDHSFIHPLTHPITHSFTHSLAFLFTHSLSQRSQYGTKSNTCVYCLLLKTNLLLLLVQLADT